MPKKNGMKKTPRTRAKPVKKRRAASQTVQRSRTRPSRRSPNSQQVGPSRSATVRSAPASVGMILPRSRFGFMGPAQRLADQDSSGSLRLTGCDLFTRSISSGLTGNGGFGGVYWWPLTPSQISARVASVEAMFQWWIIRRLRIHYVPTCGTSTGVSVALGYSTDIQLSFDIPSPTQQQVLELMPSMITPAWQVATMEIVARGTKLFESYASTGETSDTKDQGALACTMLGDGFSTTYGQLWLEYEIDFYQPAPIITGLDRLRHGRPKAKEEAKETKETKEPLQCRPRLTTDEDDGEVVDPAPVRYHPVPSGYPGAPGSQSGLIPSTPPPPKVTSRK
jgi:hypothetical protein